MKIKEPKGQSMLFTKSISKNELLPDDIIKRMDAVKTYYVKYVR